MTKRIRLILYAALLCIFCLLLPCILVSQTKEVLYVGAFNGLDLREKGNHTAKIIKNLPQYTKLLVLEKQVEDYWIAIHGQYSLWYKVQAGNETGWVLGAFLTAHAPADTPNPRKPVFLTESSMLTFPDAMVIPIYDSDYNSFYPYIIDTIKAYDSPDTKSGFSEITHTPVRLYRVPQKKEWLYLITASQEGGHGTVLDWKNQGFISVYDISEKSYYVDMEGRNIKDQIPEYALIQKYPAIFKRHGPLLEITWNNIPIRFWDDFDGFGSESGVHYSLADYYKDYDEILLLQTQLKHSAYSIYSLRQQGISVGMLRHSDYMQSLLLRNRPTGMFWNSISGKPNFNKSRNAVFAVCSRGDGESYVVVYSINHGVYVPMRAKNAVPKYGFGISVGYWMKKDGLKILTTIQDARWIDDNALQITYTDENKKEDFILLIQRKDADSDFEVVRNK